MDYILPNSIQGSFHQGYVNIFGATSGGQCSCMALYAIVLPSLKVIHSWQQEGLDLVLFLGDELYKSLNTQQYLCATDLQNNISVCNVQVQASHLPLIEILFSFLIQIVIIKKGGLILMDTFVVNRLTTKISLCLKCSIFHKCRKISISNLEIFNIS